MKHGILPLCLLPALLGASAGCAGQQATGDTRAKKPPLKVQQLPVEPPDPTPDPSPPPLLLRGTTVMTAAGAIHRPGFVLIRDGRIHAVGAGDGPKAESNTAVLNLPGRFITPGIIDTHSHIGVFPYPSATGSADGNESVDPKTPGIWAEHGFWPQDPNISRVVTGGVTTIQVLPGSTNLFGGRSFVAKLRPKQSARAMRFPGAAVGLKTACGENPKRTYGDRGGPKTRMGNIARMRAAFSAANAYRHRWQVYQRDLSYWSEVESKDDQEELTDPPQPPDRDLHLETLAKVLDGEIALHTHCYRADEMHIMLDLAAEFGFVIRSFHHAVEAYKIADRLAREDVAVSTWSDWWGFKMEAFDGVPQNAAVIEKAGGRAIIHSDDADELMHLVQEAQKARVAGRKVGIEIDDDATLGWVTANPAWALGIEDQVGTLEVGKMADLVVWSGTPFSVYSRATRVYIDGFLVFHRAAGRRPTDFELGLFADPPTPPRETP